MNVLVVYKHKVSFVHNDIQLLSRHYDVTPFFFSGVLCIPKLYKAIRKTDIIFVWFASYHAFLVTLLKRKKPMVVITGGYDASDIPNYGMFSSLIKRGIATKVYNSVDFILPVDQSLADVILKYLPQVKEKIKVIPTGYDYSYFKPFGKKKKIVLTVCYVNKTNWWRKGLKTFVEVAKRINDLNFVVVGKISENIKEKIDSIKLNNLIFTGWLSDDELLKKYQQTKVFCLLSKYEGLPNVLCEAMLCECVPVTTSVCGIPNAVGDTGFYVGYNNIQKTVDAIKKAIKVDGKEARKRIAELFTPETREHKLIEIVDEAYNGNLAK